MSQEGGQEGVGVGDVVADGFEVVLELGDEGGEGLAMIGGEGEQERERFLREGLAEGSDLGEVMDEAPEVGAGGGSEFGEFGSESGLQRDDVFGFAITHANSAPGER